MSISPRDQEVLNLVLGHQTRVDQSTISKVLKISTKRWRRSLKVKRRFQDLISGEVIDLFQTTLNSGREEEADSMIESNSQGRKAQRNGQLNAFNHEL